MKNSTDEGGCYPQRPKAEVDNTLRDLQNSSYPTKADSITALLFIQNISPLFFFFKNQSHPQVFSVNGSIICSRLHFLRHWFKKCKCHLFTHGAPRKTQELVQKCPCIPGSNWNLEMLVFEERGKPENPEKNLSEQSREPTTSSTRNRTQVTLVGGEHSQHCAIPLFINMTKRILFKFGQQQLVMVNCACSFNQSETGK